MQKSKIQKIKDKILLVGRQIKVSIKTRTQTKKGKVLFVIGLLVIGILVYFFWGMPLPTKLTSSQPAISTKLFDRNGKLIYEIFAQKKRSPIPLSDIPQSIKDATIAVEDKDFYRHGGFSIRGITRAAYNIFFKDKLQGGSTLTQQLVKTSLLTPERTIRRKVRELVLSLSVELIYSKDEILEMYLNRIPYGSTAYGVEAASELYFGKNVKDLSLTESALLAGLTAAPTAYSPFGANPQKAYDRQKTVLRRMVEDKYITSEEEQKALEEKIVFAEFNPPMAIHFALWIKEQLAEIYGDEVVEKGGLRVTTTLDLEIQEATEKAVAEEVGKLAKQNVKNGVAMVTRPGTGEILAMVGSRDYNATDEDGKVNVLFAKRQPGSSIKPINYAMALRDKKITASSPLLDVPTCFLVTGQESYCPKNYDGTFRGIVQTRFALGNSLNIPAVRVLSLNGIAPFVEFAREMGLTTLSDPKNYGLSLTLGGGEVRPYDMATAFGVFANAGVKKPLFAIQKVTDWKDKVLFTHENSETDEVRILTPEVTFLISHILYDNNARSAAFGEHSYLNVSGHPEVSVKTGTTNDRRDNWTIGYTPQILAVSWVGNNDNSEMKGAVSGVSGASPIWNRVIKKALDKSEDGAYDKANKGHSWPQQPGGVLGRNICADNGNLPADTQNPGCPLRFEYFLEEKVGAGALIERKPVGVDRTTGMMANTKTPPELIDTADHTLLTDPLNSLYCMDCPNPMANSTVKYYD